MREWQGKDFYLKKKKNEDPSGTCLIPTRSRPLPTHEAGGGGGGGDTTLLLLRRTPSAQQLQSQEIAREERQEETKSYRG